MKRIFFLLPFTLLHFTSHILFSQGTPISNFGTNPGNLNAYKYIPAGISANAPLVVVLHGCTQNAPNFSAETEWDTLAEKYKFYVAFAEQQSANNSSNCFNWWEIADHSRGQGESFSIKELTDYMKANYSIDANKVFVYGLSAGGAMTVVMLSAYPDVFSAGAECAGLPYKCATNTTQAYYAGIGSVTSTPQAWGDLVRNEFPSFTGTYPRLAIFHGTSDAVVNKVNATEVMKQFTNLHNTDQTADKIISSFNGNSSVTYSQYFDASGNSVVESYIINGMAHGIAVDPGKCYQQGGTTASYSISEAGLYSAFWAAKFFGIIPSPYNISGLISVSINQSGVTYSVPNTAGSTYAWSVPSGATIASGQGTNSINVNWGSTSGNVTVVETNSASCKIGPSDLFVTVGASGVNELNNVQEEIFAVQKNNGVEYILKSSIGGEFSASIYDMNGRIIYKEEKRNANQYYSANKNLPAGIYVVNCVTEKSNMSKKVVVF